MPSRRRILIKGIVQGIGFRPLVYRLAKALELTGFVRNTSAGVEIELEGASAAVRRFPARLRRSLPPSARIDEMEVKKIRCRFSTAFVIRDSRSGVGSTLISPDLAVCRDCRQELFSRRDRRFRFPFINCTNCGPRYSIIFDTPYDRKKTSMKDFRMCPDCAREFGDMMDRRFHAQPDCCPVCGPHFELRTIDGRKIDTADPIHEAAVLLRRGKILALKGIGGFHIACDAANEAAVKRLRRLKRRPTKPLAVMARDQDLAKIVRTGAREKKMLQMPAAPIMLLRKRPGPVAAAVAPANPYLGVMLPHAPVHHLLLAEVPFLIMTSANIQDEPIVVDDRAVTENLGTIVDYFLTNNRPIVNRCDDSVGFSLPGRGFSLIRRSRGFAPVYIELPSAVAPTLAVGPLLKNTFTLANRGAAFVSPHIGDLDNLPTERYFREMIVKYQRWFKIRPELIVHDLHPDYLSTRIAAGLPGRRLAVQHHVAHITACLAENKIEGEAIGIAFDGTGYGSDGRIWGGEFFVGRAGSLHRAARLEYLPLAGGETSIRKPYRIAAGYLFRLFGAGAGLPQAADPAEVKAVERMIAGEINLAYTSSMGRLCDCVAGMIGLVKEITFEAEAAINLEHIAARGITGTYDYEVTRAEKAVPRDPAEFVVRIGGILKGIDADRRRRCPRAVIAAKFHNTVSRFSLDISRRLSRLYGMKRVCFSGGVFQNRRLLALMTRQFEAAGFEVILHRQLPANDGCISYGQVVAGNLIAGE